MARPSRSKSRSFRRVFVKTPTATKIQFRRRKPNKAQCAVCGCNLQAIPQLHSVKMAAIAKSAKRPERPFGGVLCSKCARRKITNSARA